jgi:hypothetical protein
LASLALLLALPALLLSAELISRVEHIDRIIDHYQPR